MSNKSEIMKIIDARLCYLPVPHFGEPKVHIRLTLKRLAWECSVAFAPELLPVLLDVIDEEIDETGCTLNRVLDRPVTVERDDTGKPTALVSVYDGCERLPLTRE